MISIAGNQDYEVREKYYIENYKGKEDSLRALYGKNKSYPKKYEIAILLALSHYPELENTKITFQLNHGYIPLISRPKISSVVNGKRKRHYKIFISEENQFAYNSIMLKNIPFNAQIGIIGHELGHTVSYLDLKLTDFLTLGINYIFKKYRASFEKDTDRRAIMHGLGWQLLDYVNYTRNLPEMEEAQVAWIDQFYLNNKHIYAFMKKTGLYKI